MAKTQVPESQVEDLIKSGDFNFTPGTEVDVVGPDGEVYGVDASQVKDALAQGYKIQTARQKAISQAVEENKGLAGSLKVFAAQFADEALLNIPEMAADRFDDPFNTEVRTAIKEDHALANTLGGVGGFGTSMLYGGPVGKAATMGTKAGIAAEKIVANNLLKAGVTSGRNSLAKDILAKTAENGVRLGAEGIATALPVAGADATFESIQAINEGRLPNYEASAEALMAGGGIGVGLGVFGGATGAVLKGLKKTVSSRFKSSIEGNISATAPYKAANGERIIPDPVQLNDDSLLSAIQQEGGDESLIGSLKAELGRLKKNVDEIKAANDFLGLKTLDEELSDSEVAKRMASTITNRPTLVGIARNNEYAKKFDVYDDALKQAVGSVDPEQSLYEVGTKIKTSIVSQAEAAIQKEADVFNALRLDYQQIGIDPKRYKRFLSAAFKESQTHVSPQVRSIAKNLAEDLRMGRLSTLDDLKLKRTELQSLFGQDGAVNAQVSKMVRSLNSLEERVIDDAISARIAMSRGQPGEQALLDAMNIQAAFDEMKAARGRWRDLAESFEESGDALNLGNVKNPRDFVAKMKNETAESLAKKLIPKSDVESMRVLAQKYPEQFEVMTQFTKSKMMQNSLKEGKINPRSFVKEFNKLPKEVKDVIFTPESRRLIGAVETSVGAIPPQINPSGTAVMQSYMKMLDPRGWIDSATDAAQLRLIKGAQASASVEGVIATEGSVNAVKSRLAEIGPALTKMAKGAGKVAFDSSNTSRGLLAFTQATQASRDERLREFTRIKTKLQEVVSNPEKAMDDVALELESLNETGAPNTSAAFANKLVQGVMYLANNLPKEPAQSGLFKKPVYQPSDGEISKFERKYQVVQDPFSVIDALGNDSLTKDHVEALAAVYPQLYGSIQNQIFDFLSKPDAPEFPYARRLNLSLLMGLEAEQSVTPQAIQSMQSVFAMNPANVEDENPRLNQNALEGLNSNDYQTPSQRLMGSRT